MKTLAIDFVKQHGAISSAGGAATGGLMATGLEPAIAVLISMVAVPLGKYLIDKLVVLAKYWIDNRKKSAATKKAKPKKKKAEPK